MLGNCLTYVLTDAAAHCLPSPRWEQIIKVALQAKKSATYSQVSAKPAASAGITGTMQSVVFRPMKFLGFRFAQPLC